jgi:hypothetical protein
VPHSCWSFVGVTTLSDGAFPSISTVPAIVPVLPSATGLYVALDSSIDPDDVRRAVRACAVLLGSPEHARAPTIRRMGTRPIARDCARARRVVLMRGWCTRSIN